MSLAQLAPFALPIALIFTATPVWSQTSVPNDADNARSLHVRAKEKFDAGEFLQAETAEREAIAACLKWIDKNRGDVACRLLWAECHDDLAHAQAMLDKFADARKLLLTTRDILTKSIEFYPSEPGFRYELARNYRIMSLAHHSAMLPAESAEQIETSIALLRKLIPESPNKSEYRRDLADALLLVAHLRRDLAGLDDAEAAYHESIQVMQKLTADFPNVPEHVERLAVSYNAYALLVRESGRRAQAIDMIRHAIALLKTLETAYPERPKYWYQLPTFYRNLAQPLGSLHRQAEAKAAQSEASRLEAKLARIPNPDKKGVSDIEKVVASIQNLDMTRLVGHSAEVETIKQKAIKKVQDHPDVPMYRLQLASCLSITGIRLVGDQSAPIGNAQLPVGDAATIITKLVSDYPDVPKYRYHLAETYGRQAVTCLANGQTEEAESHYRNAFALLEKLANDYPKVPKMRFAVTEWMCHACMGYKTIGEDAKERKYFALALGEMKRLVDAFPASSEYCRHYGNSYLTLGLLTEATDPVEAEKLLRGGLREWNAIAPRFPQNFEMRTQLGIGYRNLGQFLTRRQRFQEAEEAFREQIKIHHQIAKDCPREGEHTTMASIAYSYLAEHLESQNRHAEALENRNVAIALLEAALRLTPRQPDWQRYLCIAHRQRAFTHFKLGQNAENQKDETRAKELDEKLDAPLTRMLRIESRLREDRLAPALVELEEVFESDALTGQEWFQLAECFVSASEKSSEPASREQCHTRAVIALNKAGNEGFLGIGPLDQNPRFTPLHARADFKKLASTPR